MDVKADNDAIFLESKHMIQSPPHPLLKHLCILKVNDQRAQVVQYGSGLEANMLVCSNQAGLRSLSRHEQALDQLMTVCIHLYVPSQDKRGDQKLEINR